MKNGEILTPSGERFVFEGGIMLDIDTSVVGIKPEDGTFGKMHEILVGCRELGVKVPNKVNEYFIYDRRDDRGVHVCLEKHKCCKKSVDDSEISYEIELDKLPKDIKIIRFVCDRHEYE